MTGEVDRLDAGRIRQHLGADSGGLLRQMTLLHEVDSTNAWLFQLPTDQHHAHAVIAEQQLRGRGRRQRHWHSPAGGNIYFSLGWVFRDSEVELSTLPLVTAVCLSRSLEAAGLQAHGVKWPNDILVDGRKLAGILVEMQSSSPDRVLAVIGIGINVQMPEPERIAREQVIDRPWTDLASQLPDGQAPQRNRLVAGLLNELLPALDRFGHEGFAAFRSAWEARDLLRGARLDLDTGNGLVTGTAVGVDDSGGLILKRADGPTDVFHSGEVSVIRG